MKIINLNELARKVSAMEAGKVEISIAQIKEVIKDLFCEMGGSYSGAQILEAIERTHEKYS